MEFIVFLGEQWVLVSVLLVLIVLLAFSERSKSGSSIGVHELTKLVNKDEGVVVDLRDAKEYANGHIVSAINIPFAKIKDRMAELEKSRSKQIILVDKIGQHSSAVGKQLSKEGFTVKRLSGGMSEWSNQNLPVVKV